MILLACAIISRQYYTHIHIVFMPDLSTPMALDRICIIVYTRACAANMCTYMDMCTHSQA